MSKTRKSLFWIFGILLVIFIPLLIGGYGGVSFMAGPILGAILLLILLTH